MDGTRHFFIIRKAFELKADHGGEAFIVRIYDRGRDTLRSVFMGKESAKTLLAAMEELKTLGILYALLEKGKLFSLHNDVPIRRVDMFEFRLYIGGVDVVQLLFQSAGIIVGGVVLAWNYDGSFTPRQRQAITLGFLRVERDRRQ